VALADTTPALAAPVAHPSDPRPGEPRGLAALKHLLVDDEEGSAAIEFIVLIPVYVLLMTGLFSLAQMTAAKQGLVGAVRFEAWSGKQVDADLTKPFFPATSGTYAHTWTQAAAPTFDNLDPKTAEERRDLIGASIENGKEIARAVLKNEQGDGETLMGSSAQGTFTYSGIIVGTSTLEFKTSSYVMLPTGKRRPEHQEGSQDHFVAKLPKAPFDPGQRDNQYWSPVFGQFRMGVGGGAGGDPGLWSNEARVGGSPYTEQSVWEREAPNKPEEVR
jgi:hypothetical protein